MWTQIFEDLGNHYLYLDECSAPQQTVSPPGPGFEVAAAPGEVQCGHKCLKIGGIIFLFYLGERGAPQQTVSPPGSGSEVAAASRSASPRLPDRFVPRKGGHEGTGGREVPNTALQTGNLGFGMKSIPFSQFSRKKGVKRLERITTQIFTHA